MLFALHHPPNQRHQVTFPEPWLCARSVLDTVPYLFRFSVPPALVFPGLWAPRTWLCLVEEDTSLGFLSLIFDHVEGNL